jgi:hypothetical protein
MFEDIVSVGDISVEAITGEIKEFKNGIVELVIGILRKSGMSDKTLGYVLRSFHTGLPMLTTGTLLLGPQIYALGTLALLITAYISFWVFGGCIVTSVEYKLDKMDITMMDPVVEMLGMEVNAKNRLSVSIWSAGLYMIFAFTLYYIRFGSIYLHNNIYDDLNIFKGFYQRKPISVVPESIVPIPTVDIPTPPISVASSSPSISRSPTPPSGKDVNWSMNLPGTETGNTFNL